MASCRLSICLSITLRYRDHIGWKSSKIISQLISLGCLLSADPNITDVLQGKHPEILAGIGEGYRKSGFRLTKALITLKHGKIGPWLLLMSNMRFRLVQKSATSKVIDTVMRYLLIYSFAFKSAFKHNLFCLQSK